MALNIKNRRVEDLAAEVAQLAHETKTEAVRRALEERKRRLVLQRPDVAGRHARLLRFLESEIWPLVPAEQLGKRLSKDEEEAILGFGPDGV